MAKAKPVYSKYNVRLVLENNRTEKQEDAQTITVLSINNYQQAVDMALEKVPEVVGSTWRVVFCSPVTTVKAVKKRRKVHGI